MSGLRTEKVYLRALEPEDLEFLFKWENSVDIWQDSNTLAPFSRFAIKEFIERSLSENVFEVGQIRLMICSSLDNSVVGTADIFDIDTMNSRAAIGLLVDSSHRGKGYAKDALDLLCDYARNTLLLNQLYVHIATDNNSCLNLFDKSDFEKCGTLKGWVKIRGGYKDVFVYQKIL
ncbi:MAG: GNAT family N-acetyltransferase [Muribaculaceae bacterium]|nr:GNAT family N-acetyltransferase [Muribaculaceae bacterium]